MGIRAALGASAGNMRRLIFQAGMQFTLIGLSIGVAGTFASTRVMSSMLYGVGAEDPLTISVVAVVLLVIAGLACFLPAWRITKADPMEALRYQ
jgi:putative ABC transport system permease protein